MNKEIELKEFAVSNEGHPYKECINLIMNSIYFRKLADKTQVIISLTGPNVRTRLTHTIEVAKIARDICSDLGLNNELAEAIALAHDIGHTPFGHVGERTLKEIMCGCDTLDNMVEFDFNNSGFKHNLQSFKILKDSDELSRITPEYRYILWGVVAHTKMSYTPLGAGEDNEIFIHNNHCPDVYNCYFSLNSQNKGIYRECKHNNHRRQIKNDSEKICKPWYCSYISEIKNKNESKINFNWINTYCPDKCYFAKIWAYKIEKKIILNKFPFIFDHPFPNSYYADDLYSVFCSTDKDFISIESFIVSQSDEIAQKKQDLEDGLSQNLFSLKECTDEIIKIFKTNKYVKNRKIIQLRKKFISEIENISKLEDKKEIATRLLGETVVNFFKEVVKEHTIYNFNDFVKKPKLIRKITCYNLFNLINSFKGYEENYTYYLSKKFLDDVEEFEKGMIDGKFDNLKNVFLFDISTINPKNKSDYILFKIAESLDELLKFDINNLSNTLISKIKQLLEVTPKSITTILKELSEITLNELPISIYNLPDKIFNKLGSKFNDFVYFSELNLYEFKKVNEFSNNLKISNNEAFIEWKKHFKNKANHILANRLAIERLKTDRKNNIGDGFKKFNRLLRNTILKSEIVEKNDGKASFIIKRLFKAYLTNPHQLPNECLENIYKRFSTGNEDKIKKKYNELLDYVKFEFNEGSYNLKSISWESDIDIEENREIKSQFPKELIELFKAKKGLKELFASTKTYEIRDVIDNALLKVVPEWRFSLYRGICDYISGLTDREAIREYEILYSGIMEL